MTVEPNSPLLDRGYAIVQAPRPGGAWYARFVLSDGREVARASTPDTICCADEAVLDAAAVLARWMDARLARVGPATLDAIPAAAATPLNGPSSRVLGVGAAAKGAWSMNDQPVGRVRSPGVVVWSGRMRAEGGCDR